MKPESTSARVAKIIRALLKEKYPEIKFQVRASRFSGGDAVDIDWIDGPTRGDVDALVSPYNQGRATDRRDHPTVSFVQSHRGLSEPIMRSIIDEVNEAHGTQLALVDGRFENDVRIMTGFVSQDVHRTSMTIAYAPCPCGTNPEREDRYCGTCGSRVQAA